MFVFGPPIYEYERFGIKLGKLGDACWCIEKEDDDVDEEEEEKEVDICCELWDELVCLSELNDASTGVDNDIEWMVIEVGMDD